MNYQILLVDDDIVPMEFYIKALKQSGFSVKQCYDPDSALIYAERERDNISLIILDIMLPPGRKYKNVDTNEGLITGIFLFDDLINILPHIPFIILTNVQNQETLSHFENKKEYLIKIAQKFDYPPFELVELIKEMIIK